MKEIAQHLEQQNDLLQMIRRSQEVQACAQERQAQAMEGTQAALSVLIQVLRPMIKDFRRYLLAHHLYVAGLGVHPRCVWLCCLLLVSQLLLRG